MIFTANSDTSNLRLPADAMHALFAYSLRRKLRYLYKGNYFKFRNESGEFDYPETPLNGTCYLVKIYDQKLKFGIPVSDAYQDNPSKQPLLVEEQGGVVARFQLGQYLKIDNLAEYITPDFTITTIGDGDVPRPMIGIYGDQDIITVEPGTPTNRFTFNDNFGSVNENLNNSVNQLFSGFDSAQNGSRVIKMKSDGGGSGQNLNDNIGTDFTDISIGRAKDRYFAGDFIEATMHLGDLTKLGSEQLWEEAKLVY